MNLSSEFRFPTDEEGATFCRGIVQEMMRLFHISEDEAHGRINDAWYTTSVVGSNIITYNQTEEYWAKTIYYDNAVWWSEKWLAENELRPRPYPALPHKPLNQLVRKRVLKQSSM